jgi:DNA-binding NarL/FixJ family response regulator
MNDQQLLEVARTILPPRQLQVYELYARGLTLRMIGDHLDLHTSTVRDHLAAANKNLRRHLQGEAA